MKPSSDAAMTPMSMKKSSALGALLLSTMLLGACSMFGGKPSPVDLPGSNSGGSTPSLNGTATVKPAPKPVDKGDADARFKAALELMKQGQQPDAEAALTELIKDFPQYSGPLTELGMIYEKSKRLDLAAAAFAKAVNNNPQNAVAYNWQGILYREVNDYGRAEQAYKRAISANGNYGLAHLNLGILYDVYLKRPSDALNEYKEYQRLGGADDLRVLVWVADIEKAQADARPVSPNTPPPAASQPAAAAPASGPAKPSEKKP
jgi:tetratricopeptide (TPR) repeat protein